MKINVLPKKIFRINSDNPDTTNKIKKAIEKAKDCNELYIPMGNDDFDVYEVKLVSRSRYSKLKAFLKVLLYLFLIWLGLAIIL